MAQSLSASEKGFFPGKRICADRINETLYCRRAGRNDADGQHGLVRNSTPVPYERSRVAFPAVRYCFISCLDLA